MNTRDGYGIILKKNGFLKINYLRIWVLTCSLIKEMDFSEIPVNTSLSASGIKRRIVFMSSDFPEPEAPFMSTDTGFLENLVSDARNSNLALLVFPAK